MKARLKNLCLCFAMVFAFATGCAPEHQAQPEPIRLEQVASAYKATLSIDPGIVGPNRFAAAVTDQNGQAVTGKGARLHFSMPGHEHGDNDLNLVWEDGVWAAEGPHIMMGGTWHVNLDWTDNAGQVQTFSFQVTFAEE